MLIRDAVADDAAACADIYAPYVRGTAVSFELEPPSTSELADRIAAARAEHAWLVAEQDGVVLGYAYGSTFKSRAAYRFSCEVSVYLGVGHTGHGSGRRLYGVLLPRLAELGYRTAVAGVTLPNPASQRLHLALGFQPVGTFREVGWKFERWHDVLFLQTSLGAA